MKANKIDEVGLKTATAGNTLSTLAAEDNVTLGLSEATFYEIIRRISKPNLMVIEARLELITPLHIASLHKAMSNQESFLANDSVIHDEMFPFVALKAVRMGEISLLQFGTLMALWGNLDTIVPKLPELGARALPEFVPLFTADGRKNPHASTLLLPSLRHPASLPNLVVKTPEKILEGIYDRAIHLPKSEQGFWVVVKGTQNTSVIKRTITQEIKGSVGINYLAFKTDDTREMIPSFGLQQVFLDTAFPHAVRINPVIGDSTPNDIRKGSLERYRDIALPFPGHELPKVADNFAAPTAFDFLFHDRYHAVRASRVNPHETALYVAIGDNLNTVQSRYNSAVQEISKRHDEHIRLLPEFGRAIKKLPANKKREVIEQVRKIFNQEVAIINKLKKMRKCFGQLKFRIWDMERIYSGSTLDGPEETALQELTRVLGSIESDMGVLGRIANTLEHSKYSAHRIADAVLETVIPEAVTLRAVQKQIREAREASFGLYSITTPKAQLAFDEAILAARVKFPPQFAAQLLIIRKKADELKARGYDKAYASADTLHATLTALKDQYSIDNNYSTFKEHSIDAIKTARIELDIHRGWKEILVNITLCILGAVVFYAAYCAYKGSFFKVNTDSVNKLVDLEKEINAVSPDF